MKRIVWALAGLASFGLAACSGGSSGSSSGPASTTAPSTSGSPTQGFGLVASAPQDGETDVRIDLPLYLTFSEEVDAASLTSGSIDLRTDTSAVSVTLNVVTPKVVEVKPDQPLDPNTNHLLRVTTQVASSTAARLAGDLLIRFTTGMPRVVAPPPAPGAVPPQVVGPYVAGAAAEDITPPIGVPLAGFGGGDRRNNSGIPDLNPFNYHTFLTPSTGIHDPIWAKTVVIGNGVDTFALVTLDAIATEKLIVEAAWQKAQAQGFSLPLEKVMVCSSHTHSGPGAVTKRFLWQMIAADLYVDSVFQGLTDGIARSLVNAEQAMGPAVIGVGTTQVTNATRNRRHDDSPDLNVDSIDPEMIVVRVDRPDGTVVATVWNFGVHGTIFGTKDLEYSADVMGSANLKVEAQIGGVSLFVNGAEGDIKPSGDWDPTGQILADAIVSARGSAGTQTQGVVQSVAEDFDLGAATIDWSIQRQGQTSSRLLNSGFLQAVQNFGFGVSIAFAVPQSWVAHEFRFQAARIGDTVLASLPGEPIHELGLILKADGKGMGFTHVIPACLGNGHGSYFTTEKEYWYGGYEALASFFGPKNGEKLLDAAKSQMVKIQ